MIQENQPTYKSTLVILVPEAEPLVSPFRERYDPAAKAGMPAHITINYPFRSIDVRSPQTTYADLAALFLEFPTIHFSLAEIRRFPKVIYLAPDPDQPFKALTQAVVERFPESPPYGGIFDDVIPHLTVADVDNEAKMMRIGQDFGDTARGKLPIKASVEGVYLMDTREGRWKVRHLFPLFEK